MTPAGVDGIEEWSSSEKRDALLDWTAFFAFVLVLGALFGIPMPWGAVAAAAIVAATVAVLRRRPRNLVAPGPARNGV